MKKSCFVLAILGAILSVPGLAISGERANPALAGLKQLYVIIEPSRNKASKDELDWVKIETRIGQKLVKAGFDIVPSANLKKNQRDRDIPELKIQMEALKFTDSKVYVFRAQLSLAAKVYLEEKTVFFKADAWRSIPVIQAAPMKTASAQVSHVILKQVGEFISAWHRANLEIPRASDPNDAAIITNEKTKTIVEPIKVEYKYVASEKSRVFHGTDCVSVGRIRPKNIVKYSTRTEAINSGKRPCLRCKP